MEDYTTSLCSEDSKFYARKDRRAELARDVRSLVASRGQEVLRSLFTAFCTRKGLQVELQAEADVESVVVEHVLGMQKRYYGQFRQCVCKANGKDCQRKF